MSQAKIGAAIKAIEVTMSTRTFRLDVKAPMMIRLIKQHNTVIIPLVILSFFKRTIEFKPIDSARGYASTRVKLVENIAANAAKPITGLVYSPIALV